MESNFNEIKLIQYDTKVVSLYKIKMDILRGNITLDTNDYYNRDIVLHLALSGVPLPIIYAVEEKGGKYKIVKGSNIINSLISFVNNKKNIEKYRARLEDTQLTMICIRYEEENKDMVINYIWRLDE